MVKELVYYVLVPGPVTIHLDIKITNFAYFLAYAQGQELKTGPISGSMMVQLLNNFSNRVSRVKILLCTCPAYPY